MGVIVGRWRCSAPRGPVRYFDHPCKLMDLGSGKGVGGGGVWQSHLTICPPSFRPHPNTALTYCPTGTATSLSTSIARIQPCLSSSQYHPALPPNDTLLSTVHYPLSTLTYHSSTHTHSFIPQTWIFVDTFLTSSDSLITHS